MPRRLEMGTLITRCQQRADKVGDDHIGGSDTSEWRRLISETYGDLYSVVAGTGLRYFETTATLTATGAAYVSEPSNHLATIRLDHVPASGARRSLNEIMSQEQPNWSALTSGDARGFALVDDRIYLYPAPASGETFELLYIPQSPDLSGYADDACVDVVTPDGEAFLIWGVAALALAKAKQDVTLALSRQEAARERLLEWATLRAFSQPRRRAAVNEFDGSILDSEGDRRW